MYLTWANSVFLAFLASSRINNLRRRLWTLEKDRTSRCRRPQAKGGMKMRDKRLSILLTILSFAILPLSGCVSRQDVSGVWKGTIQASAAGGKEKWQGSAELTLNQNGDALTGTLVFTHPQAGRVQVPISSGIVSKDAVTFSGQSQFPLGGSIEVTFHGTARGTSLTGTTDMTSRGLFGTVTNTGPLTLAKQ
jgi:hypothetical protein